MKKLFTFLFMAGWLISNSAFATIFLVENGSGTNTWRTAGTGEVNVVLSGTSLNAWYTTATIAVGDQVWIKNGTYVLDGSITPKGGESIYGGFAGTETAITARAKGSNAWDFTNETVLDGNKDVGNTTGTNVIAPATSNLNPTMIGGLTITKGINLAIWNMGAGATLENNTIMQNCKVFNCYLGSAGIGTSSAGVHVRGFAKLLNSYIYNNVSAGSTGGVAVLPDGIIDGCKIDGNTAAINGGGVFINLGTGGGAKVLNSTITNNSVTASGTSSNGGGINVWQNSTLTSNIEITNCTISNNSSSNVAGGFGMNQTATPYNLVVLTNVTMNANTAASSGGAISISKGDTRLNNCTLTNNVSGNVGGAINVSANTTEFTINNTLIKGNSVPDANNASAINAAFPIVCNNVVITGNKGKNHMSIVFTTTTGASFNNCTFASNTLNDGTTSVTMTQKTSGSNIYTNCLFYNCNTNPLFYQTTSGGVAPSIKNCGFDATGAGKVADGASTLHKGASDLSDGLNTLDGGIGQLKEKAGSLSTGADQLKSGTDQLATGASTLVSNNQKLNDGAGTLSDGTDAIIDGVGELSDGAHQLADGITEFSEDGIDEIINSYNGDIEPLIDRIQAVLDAGADYQTYTDIADGVNGSVKFIIKTDAVKAED